MALDDPIVLHQPVMVAEVLDAIKPCTGGLYLDATIGDGGHAEAILAASAPDGRLVGIDRDDEAIAVARSRNAQYLDRLTLINDNFSSSTLPHGPFDGILLDLGVSSRQLEQPHRGFSFLHPGPLDMNMTTGSDFTLSQLLDSSSEEELADILWEYGEERRSRSVAAAIKRAWKSGEIKSTLDLARCISSAAGGRKGKMHPATRSFQALRIAVNSELESLNQALPRMAERLADNGTLVVIAYHSLEDRIVKRFFLGSSLSILYKKPLTPSRTEMLANRRARSAKLRAARREATS